MSQQADRADDVTFEDGAGGRDAVESIRSTEFDQEIASRPIISGDSSEIERYVNVDGSDSNHTAAQTMPALATNYSAYSSSTAGLNESQVHVEGEEIVSAVTSVNGGIPFSFPLDTPPPTPASALPLTTGNVFTFQTARSAMDSLRAFSEESRQIESQVIPNAVEVAQVTEEQPSFPSMEVTASAQAFLEEVVQPTVVLTQTVEEEVYEDTESFIMDDTRSFDARSVDTRSPFFGHEANYFGHENLTRIEEEEGEAVEEGLGIEDLGEVEQVGTGEAMVVEQVDGEDEVVVEPTIENVIAPAAEEVFYPVVQPTASAEAVLEETIIPTLQFETVEDEFVTEGSEAWEVEETRSALDPSSPDVSPDVSAQAESEEPHGTPDFSIEGDDSALKALLTSGVNASSSSSSAVVSGTDVERQMSVQVISEEIITVIPTVVLRTTEDEVLSTAEEMWEVEDTKSSIDPRSPMFDALATGDVETNNIEPAAGLGIGHATREIPLPPEVTLIASEEVVVAALHDETVESGEDSAEITEAEYAEVPPRIERLLSVTAVEEVEETIVPVVVLVQAEEGEEIVDDEVSWNVDDTKSNDPMSNYASPALRGLPGPAVPEAIEELDEATVEVSEESAAVFLEEVATETADSVAQGEPGVLEGQLSVQAIEEVTVVPSVVLVTAEEEEEIVDDEVSWNVDDTKSNDPRSNYDSPAIHGFHGMVFDEEVEPLNAPAPEALVQETTADTVVESEQAEPESEPAVIERQLSVYAVEEVTVVPSVVLVTAEEEELVDDEVSWNVDDMKSNDHRSNIGSPMQFSELPVIEESIPPLAAPSEEVSSTPQQEAIEESALQSPENISPGETLTEVVLATSEIVLPVSNREPLTIEAEAAEPITERDASDVPALVVASTVEEEITVGDEVSWNVEGTKPSEMRSDLEYSISESLTHEKASTDQLDVEEPSSEIREDPVLTDTIESSADVRGVIEDTAGVIEDATTAEPVLERQLSVQATEEVTVIPSLVLVTAEEEELVDDEVSWNVDDTKSNDPGSAVGSPARVESGSEITEAVEFAPPQLAEEEDLHAESTVAEAGSSEQYVEPVLERQLSVQPFEDEVVRSVILSPDEEVVANEEVSEIADDTNLNAPHSKIGSPTAHEPVTVEEAPQEGLVRDQSITATIIVAGAPISEDVTHNTIEQKEDYVDPASGSVSAVSIEAVKETSQQQTVDEMPAEAMNENSNTIDGGLARTIEIGSTLVAEHTEHDAVHSVAAAIAEENPPACTIPEHSKQLLEAEEKLQHALNELANVRRLADERDASIRDLIIEQQRLQTEREQFQEQLELNGTSLRSITLEAEKLRESTNEKEASGGSAVEALKAELEEARLANAQLSEQIAAKAKQLEEVQAELEGVRQDFTERDAEANDFRHQLNELDQIRQDLETALTEAERERDQYGQEVEDLQLQAKLLEDSLLAKEGELAEIRVEVENLEASVGEQGEEARALKEQLASVKADLDKEIASHEELKRANDALISEKAELETEKAALLQSVTQKESQINSADPRVSEVESLRTANANQVQSKINLEASIVKLEAALTEVQTERTALIAEKQQLLAANAELLAAASNDQIRSVETHELREAHATLLTEKDVVAEKLAELETSFATVQTDYAILKEELLTVQASHQLKEQEVIDVRNKAAVLEAAMVDVRAVAEATVTATYEALKDEREALTQRAIEAESRAAEISERATQDDTSADELAALKEELKSSVEFRESLTLRAESAEKQYAEAESALVNLREELSKLQEDVKASQEVQQASLSEASELRERATTLESAVAEAKAAESAAIRSLESLQEERDSFSQRAIDAEKRLEEVTQTSSVAEAAENVSVKEELARTLELRDAAVLRSEAAETRIAELDAVAAKRGEEITVLQKDLEAAKVALKSQEQEAVELRERNLALEAALAETKSSEANVVATLTQERDVLAQKLADSVNVTEEATTRSLVADDSATLKEELVRTGADRDALSIRVEAAEKSSEEANAELVKLRAEVAALESELAFVQQSREIKEREVTETGERVEALELALAEMKATAEASVSGSDAFKAERDALAHSVADAEKRAHELATRVGVLEADAAENAAYKDQLASAIKELEASKSEFERISEAKSIVESELAAATQEVADLKRAVAETTRSLEDHNAAHAREIQTLKAEVDRAGSDGAESVLAATESLKARIVELEQQANDNSKLLSDKEAGISKLNAAINEKTSQSEAAASRVEKLQSEIASLEKKVSDGAIAIAEKDSKIAQLSAVQGSDISRAIEVPVVPSVDAKFELADAEASAAQAAALKAENESVKARLADVEASTSSVTEVPGISSLRAEIEHLKSADAQRAASHAKIVEEKDQIINELQKSVQDLKAQFAALKANSSEALLVALGEVDAGSTKSKPAEDSGSEVGATEATQVRSEELEKTVAELREKLAEAGKQSRSRSKDGNGTSTPKRGGSKSRTPTPQPKLLRVINEEADLTSPVGSLAQRLQAELSTANQQLQRKQSQILELRREVEEVMKKETVPFDMRRLFTRLSTLEDRIDIQVYEIANLQFELGRVRSMSRAQEDQIERLRQENATLLQQGVTKRTRAASAATKRNSRAVTSGGDSTSSKSQRNSFTTQDLRDILPSVMYDVLPGDQNVVLIPNSRVRDLSGLTVPGGVSGMASGSGKAREEDDIPNYNLKDVEKMLGESRQKVAEFEKQVSDLELANALLRRDTQAMRTQVTELQAEAERRGKSRKFLGGWRLKSK
ncbi:hypothetical protein BJ742DRAFT_798924 [Cladochytrium replicatum]|nr:hypothetical protein BJ742DRAFT_798924 [Cladochytrium replicatum]